MLKTLCVMTRLSLFPEILKNHYQTLYNEYDYIKIPCFNSTPKVSNQINLKINQDKRKNQREGATNWMVVKIVDVCMTWMS